MSKKKKYIRKVAAKFWVRGEFSEKDSVSCAEQLADELEKRGYFDPEPKPEPAPVETEQEIEYPWNQASFTILPEAGARIEVKLREVTYKGKFFKEGRFFNVEHSQRSYSWPYLCNENAEWRYA